ncbi:hypothetical protein [Actinomadura gamaensis]|uniref:PASTA domain-containing protein n=1 Tax=Actinomadura gamaensis TaxID=1763541 RepID=A0ABV9TU59_9ACTN
MNHDELIERLAPVTDEQAGRMVSPQTRADLADRITATAVADAPARRPRRRRTLLFGGLPLAVATAGAAVTALALSGTSGGSGTPAPLDSSRAQPAALSFSTEGRYLVVRVKDPLADPARYAREFAARGMDIKLRLVPASPTMVGTVVSDDMPASVKAIAAKGKCYSGGGACPVGMRIPVDFHGTGAIVFGRAARPGERYSSTASVFAPGEALHCANIRGLTVDQAMPVLRRFGVNVGQWHYTEKRAGTDYGLTTADRGRIPGTWYVTTADPWAPGQVMLWVQPDAPGPQDGESAAYHRHLSEGCPKR